jgi:IS30 family transposase
MEKVHLTREQRYTISAMHKQGCTQKMIAQAIGKGKSVVSRELRRKGNTKGKYLFEYAQSMAELRKERMKKPRKLHPCLKKEIIGLIGLDWSPQQVEGRLRLENKPFVSHETIYKIIRRDKAEGGTLYQHTRHRLKRRKRSVDKKISIKNQVPIDQSPEIVDKRERLGNWEIDTLVGKNNKGVILTIVERKTAFMMMEKLTHGKTAKQLTKTVTGMLAPIHQPDTHHHIRQWNGIC